MSIYNAMDLFPMNRPLASKLELFPNDPSKARSFEK